MTTEEQLLKHIFSADAIAPPDNLKITPFDQPDYLSNGEMVPWHGDRHTVLSPIYTTAKDGSLVQQVVGSYPLLGETEAMAVLAAAEAAWDNGRGYWPTLSTGERIVCMERFLKLMIAKKHEVVRLQVWEIGKSVGDTEKEFDRTVEYMEATIKELKAMDRQANNFELEQGILAQIRRAPLGIVLCMGPFNYPLNETFTTLIPALIMGNVIMFKPPKHGALLHYPLLEAFREAFPAGVVNTVYGRGNNLVPGLMTSGKINVLALIGSSRVADGLKKLHPKTNRLRAILGLDAKNAGIVLEDASIDATVKECMLGALSFNGQRCTALKILFVHRSVVKPFVAKLSQAISELKIGLPWEKGVQITPLPEPNKPDYLLELIADAKANGADVVNAGGGTRYLSMVYPALLFPVTKSMRIYREEQFGPIIPVVAFDDIEEPIQYLIEADHGQQVSIFGTNADKIASLIDPLVNQVSRVNINAQCQRGPDIFPFTGRKDSAEGTLSVHDALRAFSIRSMVATKATDENKAILLKIIEGNKSKVLSNKVLL